MTGGRDRDGAEERARQPSRSWRLRAEAPDGPFEVSSEGTFDELVVDHWLHVEQLDERSFWLRVGDARLQVRLGAAGEVEVDVLRGFYEEVRGSTSTHEA